MLEIIIWIEVSFVVMVFVKFFSRYLVDGEVEGSFNYVECEIWGWEVRGERKFIFSIVNWLYILYIYFIEKSFRSIKDY